MEILGRLTKTGFASNIVRTFLLLCLSLPTVSLMADESVGAIGGQMAVSRMGAAIYTIPFEIFPSGTNFDPQVGLEYNSQLQGYGNAGYGVSIKGISCITRVGKDPFHDNNVQKVKYEAGDNYQLDGKRLYLKTGTQGSDGSTYTPEGDPFSTLTLHGNDVKGSTSVWFELKDADGNVYQYSQRLRSYFGHPAKAYQNVAWYITSAKDKYNETINYTYIQSDNCMYPSTITYGRSGERHTVSFTYSELISPQKFFLEGGTTGFINKRLSSVTAKCQSNVYRRYSLTYDDSSDASIRKYDRLTTISVENGVGESFAPTAMDWNHLHGASITKSTRPVSTSAAQSNIEEDDDSYFFSVDLNGDGAGDIVRICHGNIVTASGGRVPRAFINISRSHVDSSGIVSYLPPLRWDKNASINSSRLKANLGGPAVCDIDGDGLGDLVLPYYLASGITKKCIFSFIGGRKVKDGNTASQASDTLLSVNLKATEDIPLYSFMDIDRDGKDEVFYIEQKKSGGYHYGGILVSGGSLIELRFTYSQNKEIQKMFIADCNADGLQDIVLLFEGGYKIYFNNGRNDLMSVFSESDAKEVLNSTTLMDYWRIAQGDFDGDGLIDFVAAKDDEMKLRFLCNNGDGTYTLTGTTDVDFVDKDTSKDDNRFAVRIADFDKDGLSDVLVSKEDLELHQNIFEDYFTYRKTQVRWFRSDGTKPVLWMSIDKTRDPDDSNEGYIFTGDFDGDGYAEIASYGSPLHSTSSSFAENTLNFYFFPTAAPVGRVSNITNGFGKIITITYASGTNPVVYTPGDRDDSVYPVYTYTLPLPLVSRVTQTNGAAGTENVLYRYEDMRIHVGGRGILGFSSMASENTTLGARTETKVTAWHNEKYIPLSTISTTTIDGRTTTDSTQYRVVTGYFHNQPEDNYFSYCKKSITTDFYGHPTKHEYDYDEALGVPTMESTYYDGRADMYRKTQYLSYVNPRGKLIPNVVIRTQKHKDDVNAYTVRSVLSYDGMGNLIKDITTSVYGNETIVLTTRYTRDLYGNILSELTTGDNVTNVSRRYEYDNAKLRLTRAYTSPSSTITAYDYDEWGNVIATRDETDATNVLTITYTYDNWGSCISTTNPDGTQSSTRTTWDSSQSYSVYKTVTTSTTHAPITTYYDSEGRELYSATTGLWYVPIVNFTDYDVRGNPIQVTQQTGTQQITTSSSYDNFGRLTYTLHSDGTSTSSTYGNRMVTTNAPTGTHTKTYDAWGNVITVNDNASSVNYTYSSIGKPLSATSGGSTVMMEYDGAGHRTKLIDPDAGTQTATYAADGTLLSETDGRGIVTTYSYDNLGRVMTKMCGDIIETTAYGTSGYGLNRIVSIARNNGRREEFEYDRFGRVIVDTRYDDNKTFEISYEYYDNTGFLKKKSYPGGIAVTYTYDSNGNVMSATANGKRYFQQGVYNGRENNIYFGSLSLKETFYHNKTLVANQILRYGTVELDRMNYIYNPSSGNLSRRWRGAVPPTNQYGQGNEALWQTLDGVLLPNPQEDDIVEDFSYDDADRLVSIDFSGNVDSDYVSYDFSYESNGNILYKTGIGEYNYESDQPHAVSDIVSLEEEMDTRSHNLSYTDEGRISQLTAYLTTHNSYYRYFYYGPGAEKWKTVDCSMSRGSITSTSTTYYFNKYEYVEKDDTVEERYYLDNGVILIKKSGELNYYQAFCDRQGSVLSVFDEDGQQVFNARYDAWGSQTVCQDDIDLHYGYCGHEMIGMCNLIDMGGRVYDPVIGRFLSCDNYVQEPDNSQNFNRYSYCLNNPLRYTDPSGELIGIDDAIIWGAIIGAVVNVGVQAHNDNINSIGDFFLAAGIGGAAGALSGLGTGLAASSIGGGILGGMVTGAATSFTTKMTEGVGNYLAFGTPLPSDRELTIGVVTGALMGGLVSGVSAKINGRSIWNGKPDSTIHPVEPVDGTAVTAGAEEQLKSKIALNQASKKITLKRLFEDSSNPSLHLERNRLPNQDFWRSLTSTEKGQYGVKLVRDELSVQIGGYNYVEEVSFKVNGVIYRADCSYIDNNNIVHIIEVKAGMTPSLTTNQQITIPALLNGGNVQIVPFGSNAQKVFGNNLPQIIKNWSFDMYWIQ